MKFSWKTINLILTIGFFASANTQAQIQVKSSSLNLEVMNPNDFASVEITVSPKSKLRHRVLHLSASSDGLLLNATRVHVGKSGKATFEVRAKSPGQHDLWISKHPIMTLNDKKFKKGVLATLKFTAFTPLRLQVASTIKGGTCIPIDIQGGVAPYSINLRYHSFYAADTRVVDGNKLCSSSYEVSALTMIVSDQRGAVVQQDIKIYPSLRFSVPPLIMGQCKILKASGGIPLIGGELYKYYQILPNNSRLPIEGGKLCSETMGPIVLEAEDSDSVVRINSQVYEPLVITTELLRQGCNTLTAKGGLPRAEYPQYNFSKVLADGSLEALDGGICDYSELFTPITIRVDDLSGQSVVKNFTLFSPPPLPIYIREIGNTELFPGECTTFSIGGNLGMAFHGLSDSSGGYADVYDYDSFDDEISGSYCAGPSAGVAELRFRDNDSAETFVLSINILQRPEE